MEKEQKNFVDLLDDQDEKKEASKTSFHWQWGLFAFGAALFISLLFINTFCQRKAFIAQIKHNLAYSIEALNQFGWDMAYDSVEFNAFPFFNLTEIHNLKIYNKYNKTMWNTQKLTLDNSVLSPSTLDIHLGNQQLLNYANKPYKLEVGSSHIALSIENGGKNKILSTQIYQLSLKDVFDAEELNFGLKILEDNMSKTETPWANCAFEIQNIKLNGLLNYPLGQNIKNILISSHVLGKIDFTKDFKTALREWLIHGGYVDMADVQLNWPPLLMVGKGQLTMNENFAPILRLNTTSKALNLLIDDLEKSKWLDSKGVFVARILLSNKSYKNEPNDEYLTVTTPISLQDDALLIEKIAVKKFN